MGQEQGKPQQPGGGSGSAQQQQHQTASGASSLNASPDRNATTPGVTPSATHIDPSLPASSRGPSPSPTTLHGMKTAAFATDDEVLALWQQLEQVPLPLPLLKSTAVPIDEEVKDLEKMEEERREEDSKNGGKGGSAGGSGGGVRESSPLTPFLNTLGEIKRLATNAASPYRPGFEKRSAEVVRMQKQYQQQKEKEKEKGGGGESPQSVSLAGAPSQQQQQQHALPTIAVGPLLQTLGRTQTMAVRETGKSIAQSEKLAADCKTLAHELDALRAGALQTVTLGQKCYGIETEVKRLHLELHGDKTGSPAAKAIGHREEGGFPPLPALCDEVAALLAKIDQQLEPAAKRELQKYASTTGLPPAPPPATPLSRNTSLG